LSSLQLIQHAGAVQTIIDAIVIGEHGLKVIRGTSKGLLLPQVASERHWSAERFLEETCEKAGLPRTAWRDPATQVFKFTAQVFSDSSR
jgi:uncharacterized protein (TIGR00296 family)